ncbi:MAG: hypothetical protein RL701_5770 [Pseudomonadota bacterium]|jgi:hypothetical protein
MNLSETQRKYLIQDHVIAGSVINALLNAGLAWLGFRHHADVPMTGDPGIIRDTIATMVLLPLFTCVIVTPLVRKSLAAGKVEALYKPSPERSMLLWLPSSSFLRGLTLALASLALCGAPILGIFLLAGVDAMSVGGYVLIKAIYAGVLAAIVSSLSALYVLASAAVSGGVAQLAPERAESA